MPQFDLSIITSQLFWLATVFSFLYIVVSKFIAPKAESILTARNRCLEENINYAEEFNDKVAMLNILKLERLAEANALAEDMRKQSIEILEANFDQQVKELQIALDKELEQAINDINAYVTKFHATDHEPRLKLAAFIIQKITNKPADIKLLEKIHGQTK